MPNEPGHTPGPWTVHPHEYHTAELMGAKDKEGYRTYIANLYNTNHRETDWALIAAAPDLLQVARLVLAAAECEDDLKDPESGLTRESGYELAEDMSNYLKDARTLAEVAVGKVRG